MDVNILRFNSTVCLYFFLAQKMKKYKEFWYELKHNEYSIDFCFYNTEDKFQNAWCFNAEKYGLEYCYKYIKLNSQ